MSNLDTFVDNLAAELALVDANLGTIFKAERRWSSDSDLKEDGAVIVIDATGLFDAELDFGNATRFWIIEAWQVRGPLTNATDEVRGNVRLIGFFGWKDNPQDRETASKLRDAAQEILDRLALKATELTALGVGMGTGYNGFLTERPSMEGPVRTAQLQTGAQGHVAQITASYFEEVSR